MFFYSENGELEPPPHNPFVVDVEGESLADIGFHEDRQVAYSDDKILINAKKPLSEQSDRIPRQIIHVYPKGHAVLDVN